MGCWRHSMYWNVSRQWTAKALGLACWRRIWFASAMHSLVSHGPWVLWYAGPVVLWSCGLYLEIHPYVFQGFQELLRGKTFIFFRGFVSFFSHCLPCRQVLYGHECGHERIQWTSALSVERGRCTSSLGCGERSSRVIWYNPTLKPLCRHSTILPLIVFTVACCGMLCPFCNLCEQDVERLQWSTVKKTARQSRNTCHLFHHCGLNPFLEGHITSYGVCPCNDTHAICSDANWFFFFSSLSSPWTDCQWSTCWYPKLKSMAN